MKFSFFLMVLGLSLSHMLNAQNSRQALSFDFGYGINSYSMANLNEFYIDSFASKPNVDILDDYIESGQLFRLGVNYKPMGLFDLGIYGSYQFGNSCSRPVLTETDEFGFPINQHIGTFELRTEAFSIGINSTLYLSHLFKFQDKENVILNRLHIGLELGGGIGFSKAVFDLHYPSLPPGSVYEFVTGRSFQGQLGFKTEFDFTKAPLITSLGIRFGFQYFRTNTMKDRIGNDWVVQEIYPMHLDFSGIYFGTYLKLGR